MNCPYCHRGETKVIDSRDVPSDIVWRRRQCQKCAKRCTTYERIELLDITVIKKDGKKERFDRAKLVAGVQQACNKRPITTEKIEHLAERIESLLRKRKKVNITSREIGELVITRLKRLDHVAYLRFASVYKEFDDAKHFKDAASQLLKKEVKI